MRESFDEWASRRMLGGERCRVAGSLSCIPLRGDAICRECYGLLVADEEAGGEGDA